MRAILAAFLLASGAALAPAETFDLGKYGKLDLYPVGEWKIQVEDVGDLKVTFTPKVAGVNAVAQMTIAAGGADDFPTRDKLQAQLITVGERMIAAGQFVESEPKLKTFYPKQGFGAYYLLTDPRLVGKDPVPGDFKTVMFGLIRANEKIMIRVQIMSDGETTEGFQQLAGMIEGMELTAK
ncbi:MAG TPA: hypothetical protein VHD61_13790 [Lacunisphaera sp.]|nr:hypothetical protein [Lacunisphaera sp.]